MMLVDEVVGLAMPVPARPPIDRDLVEGPSKLRIIATDATPTIATPALLGPEA